MVKNPPANASEQVQSLVWEEPACRDAAKPVGHNYGAFALESRIHNYWVHTYCKAEPPLTTTRENPVQQWRSSTVINKYIVFLKRSKSLYKNATVFLRSHISKMTANASRVVGYFTQSSQVTVPSTPSCGWVGIVRALLIPTPCATKYMFTPQWQLQWDYLYHRNQQILQIRAPSDPIKYLSACPLFREISPLNKANIQSISNIHASVLLRVNLDVLIHRRTLLSVCTYN